MQQGAIPRALDTPDNAEAQTVEMDKNPVFPRVFGELGMVAAEGIEPPTDGL